MQTRSKNKITKPKTKFSLHAEANKTKPTIPNTVNQALRDPRWRAAMCDEMDAQIHNKTFDIVPHNANQNILATKWIYTLNYLHDGVLDRYKTRLVARGFNE